MGTPCLMVLQGNQKENHHFFWGRGGPLKKAHPHGVLLSFRGHDLLQVALSSLRSDVTRRVILFPPRPSLMPLARLNSAQLARRTKLCAENPTSTAASAPGRRPSRRPGNSKRCENLTQLNMWGVSQKGAASSLAELEFDLESRPSKTSRRPFLGHAQSMYESRAYPNSVFGLLAQ